MAISAQLSLNSGLGGVAGLITGVGDVYDIIKMDYQIIQNYDSWSLHLTSGPLGGLINVTIRGKTQVTTPLHEWIHSGGTKTGTIYIYDSSSILGAVGVKDSSVSDDIKGFVTNPIDEGQKALDDKIDHTKVDQDKFDKMDRDALEYYISRYEYNIVVSGVDSDDTVREMIRLYEKRLKDDPGYDAKVTSKDIPDSGTKDSTTEKVNNSEKSQANTLAHDTLDVVASAVSNAADNIVKLVLDRARVIEFTDAYCVSLKETFSSNESFDMGSISGNAPWQIELGILANEINVYGWNDTSKVNFKFRS